MTSACGRGAIYIMDNEYRQMLIAISEAVPENPDLVTRIQEVFTAASARLYQATKWDSLALSSVVFPTDT